MIISFKKILLTILPIICFSSAFADNSLVEDILQSGALPTGSATLASLNDKNGESVTQSVLQGADFWNSNTGINWDPSTTATDTVGNPWLKFTKALPVHRKGQEGYSSFYDTTIVVNSTDDYKKITGLYGYNITIKLMADLNFSGESLPPLFNIVAFIGNNHTIFNFSIKGDCQYVGLLTTVTDSVCDLTLIIKSFENMSNTGNAGALIGYLPSTAKMWNCHVRSYSTSRATVLGTNYVGGLVGYSEGTIDSCSVSGINVKASNDGAGGLVGYSIKNITNCSVDSASITAGRYYAGGLAGNIGGTNTIITNNKVDSVSVYSANTHAGGLLGNNGATNGTISDCSVKNAIVTAESYQVGGLVGANFSGISKCSVSSAKVSTKSTTTGGYVGGLVGNSLGSKDIDSNNVNSVTVSGYERTGGLIGNNSAVNTISNNIVKDATISGTSENIGGLIGINSAANTISNNIVKGGTISGTKNIGGLIGNNSAVNTISQCCVDTVTVTVTATDGFLGGLVANNTGNISDCSVSRATLFSVSTTNARMGGIVGSNNIGATVNRCLITGSTITSNNNDPITGYIGGIVGYNSGSVSNCVAMIKYFDVKALYTKASVHFGRIAAVKGSLEKNYGWVETTIRVYEKRFGVNWGSTYYRGTGEVGAALKNGGNLYTGDVYEAAGGSFRANRDGFWSYCGYTADNGWYTDRVGSGFFPKLTMVKDSALGDIGSARGFEYEYWQLAKTGNTGDYNAGNNSTVKIFTPQFFGAPYDNGYYAQIIGLQCDLYTDLYLSEDNGSGSSVFWGVDFNQGTGGNFSSSAIRCAGSHVVFNGHGHSIINFTIDKRVEKTPSLLSEKMEFWGFFLANTSALTINRLELEDPVGLIHCNEYIGIYLRYGFLVTMGTSVGLNDIYVKNPRLITHSSFSTSYGKIVWDFNVNGVAGTLVGSANYINGSNVVVYFSEGSYMRGTFISDDYPSSFTHYGCLFGSISNEIKLDGVAVSVYNSDPARHSLYNHSYRPYRDEGGSETKPFLKGFISGLRGNDATLNLDHYSFHDGYTGNFADLNPVDVNPNGSWGFPVPWILKLGESFGYSDVGTRYPNAGSFYNTLVNSQIISQPNWHFPSPFDANGVYLNRDEYTGGYN